LIRKYLDNVWYGTRAPNFVLKTLEGVYRRGLESRRKKGLANLRTDLEAWPIVVVGNVTAGGTGKTPLVIRLCEILTEAGWYPGVISRGYGRISREPQRVDRASIPSDVGDEPLIIARRCRVPVAVDEDREAAALSLFEDGVDVVISDDGLQRWGLPRDIEVCVVDSFRRIGNGHLIPAGPLREPATRLDEVDYVVLNGDRPWEDAPKEAVRMSFLPGDFQSLEEPDSMTADEMREYCAVGNVHAVAGIGNPDNFFSKLISLGIIASKRHVFADHHEYSVHDFKKMQGVILMTEKDAVKCGGLGLKRAWYLPISAELPDDWERGFLDRVVSVIEAKRP
jgi:tetraacyldisaccharide 4'-kinase